jgi:signal transduction histidine kinase
MALDLGQAARPALSLLLVVPAGLTLAWRLRVPVLPVLAICAVNLVLMATAPKEFGPQTVVFGVLVAVYSLAVHGGRLARWVGGVSSLLLLFVAHVATGEGDVLDFLPFLVWGAPWAAGRLVRRQTRLATEAGARAALLEVEARDATSRDRDRIARELHDVVGHAVSLMVVQAGADRMSLATDQDRRRVALEAIEQTGRTALVELRAMLGVLRETEEDEALSPLPALDAVPALVDAVRAAGLEVDLQLEKVEGLQPGLGLALYRVVQEALTNALRHGHGPVTVRLVGEPEVRVTVRNRVAERPQPGAGVGLVGLRERAEAYGGRVSAGRDGADWVLDVVVPSERTA